MDHINPEHYKKHPSGVEAADILKFMPYLEGNAMKYLWRAGSKPGNSKTQDLQKAQWYINKAIEFEQGKGD